MVYVYLIGTGVYAIIWLIFFTVRKDLRTKMLLTSLFSAPLGISEFLFIPEYWVPQFQTIPLFKELFLESILFCFFLGGVISVIYQVLSKEKLFEFGKVNPFLTLIAPALFLTYFLKISNLNPIYYVFFSMLLGSFVVIYSLKKNNSVCYNKYNFVLYFLFYRSIYVSTITCQLPAPQSLRNFT